MFVFLLSDSRIMSHLPWQTRLLDSESVITHFSSNTCGTSDIRILHSFSKLQPTPCMHVVCHMLGLGLSRTSKQNILSLFLLISLAELTNQNRGNCRHLILYFL